jgi:hypothetical protein
MLIKMFIKKIEKNQFQFSLGSEVKNLKNRFLSILTKRKQFRVLYAATFHAQDRTSEQRAKRHGHNILAEY